MKLVKIVLMLIVGSFVIPAVAQETSSAAQNFEITGQVGGQINGGYDLSTAVFHRIEVANGVNYGITTGYLLGEHYGIEFQWNHNSADTRGQAIGGISSLKLFSLNQNQYMGNFLFHFTSKEARMRPFIFFGLGANALNTSVSGVSGSTRFAYALGGGAKYNVSRHLGLRGQLRWAPTYLTTTNGGYWCDPIWGGCWAVGNSHYLHEFDITGGITLRF
jgi:opacity protein-like surface antigen